jgi:ubiquitin-conjugating enzyme E2 variant
MDKAIAKKWQLDRAMVEKWQSGPLFLDARPDQALVGWFGVVTVTALDLWYAIWLARHFPGSGQLYLLALYIPLGLFLADVFSGLLHWVTDTWFNEEIGGRLIRVGREHHVKPRYLLHYGFRDQISYPAWPVLIVFGPLGLLQTLVFTPTAINIGGVAISLVITVTMYFSVYAHRLGHMNSPSAFIRFLQRANLIMSPQHHSIHHRGNHDIHYCVIFGWGNYILDPIKFWRGLEWLVVATTGATPRADDEEWQATERALRP